MSYVRTLTICLLLVYFVVLQDVTALINERIALQLDQLSEQILSLFDSVWFTLQSSGTNFHARFKLQLNWRYVFLIRWQTEFV